MQKPLIQPLPFGVVGEKFASVFGEYLISMNILPGQKETLNYSLLLKNVRDLTPTCLLTSRCKIPPFL